MEDAIKQAIKYLDDDGWNMEGIEADKLCAEIKKDRGEVTDFDQLCELVLMYTSG